VRGVGTGRVYIQRRLDGQGHIIHRRLAMANAAVLGALSMALEASLAARAATIVIPMACLAGIQIPVGVQQGDAVEILRGWYHPAGRMPAGARMTPAGAGDFGDTAGKIIAVARLAAGGAVGPDISAVECLSLNGRLPTLGVRVQCVARKAAHLGRAAVQVLAVTVLAAAGVPGFGLELGAVEVRGAHFQPALRVNLCRKRRGLWRHIIAYLAAAAGEKRQAHEQTRDAI